MTTPRNERFFPVEQKQTAQQTPSRNAAARMTKTEPNTETRNVHFGAKPGHYPAGNGDASRNGYRLNSIKTELAI